MRSFPLLTSLLISTQAALANAAMSYSESDFLDHIPTTEAATRYSMPLSKAPSSVTLITREMIDAMPMVNFVDL